MAFAFGMAICVVCCSYAMLLSFGFVFYFAVKNWVFKVNNFASLNTSIACLVVVVLFSVLLRMSLQIVCES
jgi:hypothetical protein